MNKKTILLIAGILCCLCAAVFCWKTYEIFAPLAREYQEEAEQESARAALTAQHGEEVKALIRNFEDQWYSEKAVYNYELQRSLATADYLKRRTPDYPRQHQLITLGEITDPLRPTDFAIPATSVDIVKVWVWEYSPDKIRAFAYLKYNSDQLSPSDYRGWNQAGYPIGRACRLFIFIPENQVWKLHYTEDYNSARRSNGAEFDSHGEDIQQLIEESPTDDPCHWYELDRSNSSPVKTPTAQPATPTPSASPTPIPTFEIQWTLPEAQKCLDTGGNLEVFFEKGRSTHFCFYKNGTECDLHSLTLYDDCGSVAIGPATVVTPSAANYPDLFKAAWAHWPAGTEGGVAAQRLTVPAGDPPLWAVYNVGYYPYIEHLLVKEAPGSLQKRFLAIYTWNSTGWKELDRIDYDYGDSPDRIYVENFRQPTLDPNYRWLLYREQYDRGDWFELLRFDGQTLHLDLEYRTSVLCRGDRPAGELQDLDKDGLPEVLFDKSECISCLGCGMYRLRYQIQRWNINRKKWEEITLRPLSTRATPELQTAVSRTLELASADLWLDAQQQIHEAQTLARHENQNDLEILNWNARLIDLQVTARTQDALDIQRKTRLNGLPLLYQLYLGDYAAAVAPLRALPPEQRFTEETLYDWGGLEVINQIYFQASKATEARPDLAEAWFLKGWCATFRTYYYLQKAYIYRDEAVESLRKAAELRPDDPLFTPWITPEE